jgi:glycerol-3-phosphate O-acyltransferase
MSQKEQNVFCRNLGNRVIHAINEVSVVTPHALVASAILNCDKKGFAYAHLMNHIETYLTYLLSQSAKLADTLLLEPIRAVEQVIDSYVQNKLIDRIQREKESSPDDMLRVIEGKRPVLEYYKNNSISFFIPASFTALSILVKDAFQFSASDLHAEYTRLQEFFKLEFIPDIGKTPEHLVRKNIKAFINDAVLMPHPTLPDTYNVTSAGFRKLKLFSNFLKTYFESYWITLNYFMQNSQNAADPKERLKKIHSLGNRMYKRNEVERIEALSGMNFQNAVEYFMSHGIKGEEDQIKIQVYADAVQRYLNHLS